MSFFTVAISVVFVLLLVILAFYAGIGIANNYNRQIRRSAEFALNRHQEAMRNNYQLSERERYWNANYTTVPFGMEGNFSKNVIPLPYQDQFAQKLSDEGRATVQIHRKGWEQ